MTTRTITLTPQMDAYIDELLARGVYADASEAMRAAVRALQLREAEDGAKLELLRQAIDDAFADLERGDFEDVDDADLEAWMDKLVVNGP